MKRTGLSTEARTRQLMQAGVKQVFAVQIARLEAEKAAKAARTRAAAKPTSTATAAPKPTSGAPKPSGKPSAQRVAMWADMAARWRQADAVVNRTRPPRRPKTAKPAHPKGRPPRVWSAPVKVGMG